MERRDQLDSIEHNMVEGLSHDEDEITKNDLIFLVVALGFVLLVGLAFVLSVTDFSMGEIGQEVMLMIESSCTMLPLFIVVGVMMGGYALIRLVLEKFSDKTKEVVQEVWDEIK